MAMSFDHPQMTLPYESALEDVRRGVLECDGKIMVYIAESSKGQINNVITIDGDVFHTTYDQMEEVFEKQMGNEIPTDMTTVLRDGEKELKVKVTDTPDCEIVLFLR